MAHRTADGSTHVREHQGRRWALTRDDGTTYSGTATEVLGQIVAGHDATSSEEDNLYRRYEDAVTRATVVQASVYAAAVREGSFDPMRASEDVLVALLADRAEPVVDVREWREVVPVVLVSTDYRPFTTLRAPTGNIAWLDPSTAARYLDSLAAIGSVEVRRSDGRGRALAAAASMR